MLFRPGPLLSKHHTNSSRNPPPRYGTQQPIAILKLLLEKQGMYGRTKDLDWKMIKDVSFLAAMVRGSQTNVDPRFISKFSTFNFDIPSDATVAYIYSSILKGHVNDFGEDLLTVVNPIVTITLNLFKVKCFSLCVGRAVASRYINRRKFYIGIVSCLAFRRQTKQCLNN